VSLLLGSVHLLGVLFQLGASVERQVAFRARFRRQIGDLIEFWRRFWMATDFVALQVAHSAQSFLTDITEAFGSACGRASGFLFSSLRRGKRLIGVAFYSVFRSEKRQGLYCT
jgi:hypothetical protein